MHKMTGRTAEVFGIVDRGVIREGAYADLVLFDPATVRDAATFADPTKPADGILKTWINGQLAYEAGSRRRARWSIGDAQSGIEASGFYSDKAQHTGLSPWNICAR